MGDYFVCSKTDPVVETKAGKVRGFRLNTTYAFHGIHYAEADRFQMPQPAISLRAFLSESLMRKLAI